MPEITLAIIGTAGRKDDAKRLTTHHFKAMCLVAEGLIEQINESNYPITHLVSGGAAWTDHVAVRLFLDKKAPGLRIFMPAAWDGGSYHDNGKQDAYENPGGTANHYHKLFQNSTGINSLSDILIAQVHGAELIPVLRGFYARNALVAKSDFILACTFGDGKMVKEGGTADTIRKYLARVRKDGIFDKSFHYDLTTKSIYEGCLAPPEKKKFDDADEAVKQLAHRVPSLRGARVIGMHSYP
jgi:hypothetical protein